MATSVLDTSSQDSGFETCRTGSANPVAFNFLIWDVSVNIFLTLVFSRHFRPPTVKGLFCRASATSYLRRFSSTLETKARAHNCDESICNLAHALLVVTQKAFWRCLAGLVSTVVDFSLLLFCAGREEAKVFFSSSLLMVCLNLLYIIPSVNSSDAIL